MKKGGQVIKLKVKTTVWKWEDASCRSLVTNLACGSHLSVTLGMYFLIDHCTKGASINGILLPKLFWRTVRKNCSKAHSLCKLCLHNLHFMKKGSSSPNLSKLKVGDFQKKIGIIYRTKQICRFTILNSSCEFSRFFCQWC